MFNSGTCYLCLFHPCNRNFCMFDANRKVASAPALFSDQLTLSYVLRCFEDAGVTQLICRFRVSNPRWCIDVECNHRPHATVVGDDLEDIFTEILMQIKGSRRDEFTSKCWRCGKEFIFELGTPHDVCHECMDQLTDEEAR